MTTPTPDVVVVISLQPPPVLSGAVILTQGNAYQIPAGVGFVGVKTGVATAITLPAAPVAGQRVAIKDCLGVGAAEPITVIPAAGLIDGAADKVISTAYGALDVEFDGANWGAV